VPSLRAALFGSLLPSSTRLPLTARARCHVLQHNKKILAQLPAFRLPQNTLQNFLHHQSLH
jgi:hypothetical protein